MLSLAERRRGAKHFVALARSASSRNQLRRLRYPRVLTQAVRGAV